MSQLTDFKQGRIIGCWEAGETLLVLNHSQSQITCAIKAFKEDDQTIITPPKKYK